jgi:hypothetical protein
VRIEEMAVAVVMIAAPLVFIGAVSASVYSIIRIFHA